MCFQSGDLESVYMCLFPFSLTGKTKEWLKSHPQNKIMTQQIEQLTAQMARLPQKLHAVDS